MAKMTKNLQCCIQQHLIYTEFPLFLDPEIIASNRQTPFLFLKKWMPTVTKMSWKKNRELKNREF